MLVGSSPTGSLGQKCPKSWLRHCRLSRLFLIGAPVRKAEQMVDVGLDRHGLPHIPLGLPVLGIEGLFLVRQLPPLFFQRVHFGELFTAQQFIHSGSGRPVGAVRLGARRYFFEYRLPCSRQTHGSLHSPNQAHEPGDFGEGGLGGLSSRPARGSVNRRRGLLPPSAIIVREVVLCRTGGRRHSASDCRLSPTVHKPGPCPRHALLDVNDKAHLSGRGGAFLGSSGGVAPLITAGCPRGQSHAEGGCPERVYLS